MLKLISLSILLKFAHAGLDLSDMPRSICGWPSLHTGGKFPEWNTRLAQYLLNYVLNETNPVDGIFTDETTASIEKYQTLKDLNVNGYLNIDTWPYLCAEVVPLNAGSSGLPVKALQDSLTANGYDVVITGEYDDETVAVLSKFQKDRGATLTSGETVDDQTWHLLTSQCNISMPGYYWFDAGWPQGNISISTFECLLEHNFEYAVIECWVEKYDGTFWSECVDNIANARAAGFEYVDVYMYPERYRDPSDQATELLANLTANNVQYNNIMIDVEGSKWDEYSQEENRNFMLSLQDVFTSNKQPLTVYAGSRWNDYFGEEFTAFKDSPLVYAHYDNVPSFYDYDYAPFGGWDHAAGKQFWDGVDDEILCDLPLDWDWSPDAFWKD